MDIFGCSKAFIVLKIYCSRSGFKNRRVAISDRGKKFYSIVPRTVFYVDLVDSENEKSDAKLIPSKLAECGVPEK